MTTTYVSFSVYRKGPLTVIGFGSQRPNRIDLGVCRDELTALLKSTHCRSLAVDLTNVRFVPSGMLGLLATISKVGVELMIFNPNREIRDVLEITKLDSIMRIETVAIKGAH
jgi:anti-anti-sigma factor